MWIKKALNRFEFVIDVEMFCESDSMYQLNEYFQRWEFATLTT